MENLDFKSFFNEKIKARGLTLKKVADLSGIPIGHLESMARGAYNELPPAPYMKGYLRTLGKILDFDPTIWSEYLREAGIVIASGREDSLPKNRFALRSMRKYVWIAAVVVILGAYVGLRFSKIIGRPTLVLTYPAEDTTNVSEEMLLVTGRTADGDTLYVNSEPVVVNHDGTFEKQIFLLPGSNEIVVEAKKILGSEIRYSRRVIYTPEPEPAKEPVVIPPFVESSPTSTPTSTLEISE